MILDAAEQEILKSAADTHGVDVLFLCAVRKHEAGGPQHPNVDPDWKAHKKNPYLGGEMGVQTLRAPTLLEQAAIAANSVRHRIGDYGTVGTPYPDWWIGYFAGIWAPPAVSPMNQSWPIRVIEYYRTFLQDPGMVGVASGMVE